LNPVKLSAMEDLTKSANSVYNKEIDRWKKGGKQVVGYLCSYIPEEVFYAAGILPIRVAARGCTETSHADALMGSLTCSFSRACFELALTKEYDFLDGLVHMNSCENIRRMADNWRYKASPKFTYALSTPHRSDQTAVKWYNEELCGLIEAMGKHFKTKVTDQKLREAVELCNETRQLLRELYDLRKSKAPPISGTNTHKLTIMASAMPKGDYNDRLKSIIKDAKKSQGISDYRARIMIVGSMLDDSSFTQIIEDSGGLVVADATCYGSLSFWQQIPITDDPLDGIAKAYLGGLRCPRQPLHNKGYASFLATMVKDYKVDGIIFERMLHCSIWATETLSLEKDTKDLGIPMLILEREYVASGLGQLKTRIEAFIELIEGGKR
jgi:benzoyl-CoA reductase subunit C